MGIISGLLKFGKEILTKDTAVTVICVVAREVLLSLFGIIIQENIKYLNIKVESSYYMKKFGDYTIRDVYKNDNQENCNEKD